FSSRRRHTRFSRDWSSDVCSSDLERLLLLELQEVAPYWGGRGCFLLLRLRSRLGRLSCSLLKPLAAALLSPDPVADLVGTVALHVLHGLAGAAVDQQRGHEVARHFLWVLGHRHDGKDRQVVIGLEIDLGQIRLAHAHLVVRPQPQGIDDDKGQVGIVQRLQKGKGARGIVADQSVLAVPLKAQKPLFKPDDRFLGDFQRAKTGALNLHRRAPFTAQPAPQPNTEYRSPTTEMVIAAFCMRYARTA